jgi:cytochrome b
MFHWLVAGLVAFAWWSAEYDRMGWHIWAGLGVSGLLAFRVLWGFFGSQTARFSSFLKGPRAVLAYLRGDAGREALGHNPLGGWSVAALLATLCVQVVSGLFAVDVDGIESGPLSYLVDFDQGRWSAAVHEASFNTLLALIALHVAAILFYLVMKRQNLVGAMITGFRTDPGGSETVMIVAPRWRLFIAVILSALLVYGLERGFRF